MSNDVRERILSAYRDALAGANGWLSWKDLAKMVKTDPRRVSDELYPLLRSGEVVRKSVKVELTYGAGCKEKKPRYFYALKEYSDKPIEVEP